MSFLTDRPVLIASTVVGTATSTITFSNITSKFTNLIIYGGWASNRAGQTGDSAAIRFNGDSTSAYYNSSGTLQTYGDIGNPMGATALAGNAGFSHITIYIPSYATTGLKQTTGIGSSSTNASYGQTVNTYTSVWSNSSAITSIAIIALYGAFTTNSNFQLWGY